MSRRLIAITAAWLAVGLAGTARAQAPASTPAPPGPVAIVNVTVIPMDTERVLRDQTVVVEGRRILALGPTATVAVPEGALRVEGRGRFLIRSSARRATTF